jgi:succinate dehydrogenase / fumarate reductase iron-sulfur subunit
MRCHFTVYRFDPIADKKPRYQEYGVDAEPTDKILDCLNKIRWEQDPTLGYRYSCAHGICGSDALMINGKIELACQKLVRDFKTGNNFVIEPLPPFFEKYRQVQPYLIPGKNKSDKEFIQQAEDQEFIEPALRCILCASCTAACPINRARSDYLGPAALLRAFRYIFDTRDSITAERLSGGVRRCGGAPKSAPKKYRSPNVWGRSNAPLSSKKKTNNGALCR